MTGCPTLKCVVDATD